MVSLSTRYLGFELHNPLIASCSPLTGRLDVLRRLEDSGVSAVVLPSIFEEQLDHERSELSRVLHVGSNTFSEAVGGYFPHMASSSGIQEQHLRTIEDAKRALSIPVFVSLNGTKLGSWIDHCGAASPKHSALISAQGVWTFSELNARIHTTAARLAAWGVRPGSRAAVLMPNWTPYVLVAHALMQLGAVIIPINTRLSPS
ncbi:MAG: AMP-binding protein, partial [Myxococcales bacterium]|nr:AMP-binding protein [Myxococcales bacterium]